jgi:hypothetical protein
MSFDPSAERELPVPAALERVSRLLEIPGEPERIAEGDPVLRRQAALLARIATWAEVYLAAAEELAGMELLEVAANHQAADIEFADSPALERVQRGAALLNLQIARLNRAHHVVFKGRGEISSNAVPDAALAALEGVIRLLEAWRSAHRPGQAPVFVEDRLTGAIDEELVAAAAERLDDALELLVRVG